MEKEPRQAGESQSFIDDLVEDEVSPGPCAHMDLLQVSPLRNSSHFSAASYLLWQTNGTRSEKQNVVLVI